MLDEFTQNDLDIIKKALANFWGDDCIVKQVSEKNSRTLEFEIHLNLFNAVDVGLAYDRGTMDIGIKVGEKYKILQNFTDKKVYRGFEVMKPEIMHHNFSILYEVAKQLAFSK